MQKQFAVYFTKNNARIIKNPQVIAHIRDLPNVVVNPDLQAVAKTPPHLWKLENGLVKPMNAAEASVRYFDINASGADNEILIPDAKAISPPPVPKTEKKESLLPYLGLAVAAAVISFLIRYYVFN